MEIGIISCGESVSDETAEQPLAKKRRLENNEKSLKSTFCFFLFYLDNLCYTFLKKNILVFFLQKINTALFLFLATIELANCYFLIENSDEKESILDRFRIENKWNGLNDFPQYFEIKFKQNGQVFKHRKYPDIHVIDKDGNPKKYALKKSEDFQHYINLEGNAYATLIKNNNSDDSYRFIGRIFSKTEANTTFDIYPVKKVENPKTFNPKNKYYHAIKKRNTKDETKNHSFLNTLKNKDYIVEKKKSLKSANLLRKLTKSGTGQFVLNLETIIVADYSLINEHKRISKSEDLDVVFNNLRIYLSHVMHAVDQKYQNSFKNDNEMKINIFLTNFVFVTDPAEAPWVDPSLVGDPNNPTYDNQDVIVATPTIQSFKNYMESKTFPFEYDHAMALFKKDLWADGNDIPENRKGVAGFAYVAGTCENIRYSVTEEQGGFRSIFD
ncbi:A disintegrin and metallo ase with thrombospondin motifs 5-like [Brachionus plicatilis]|uniref:A disintegrin and metallo ase with thrombospondin motifs 5-like n=1 Tax=Brachionus plicatilis TaxID=10195 RepID=A0A3M7Q792_BRAPC|nr:A disintegrin and metallo ase with thrombospondin motifs 5-like [Brachionus plicatilis]